MFAETGHDKFLIAVETGRYLFRITDISKWLTLIPETQKPLSFDGDEKSVDIFGISEYQRPLRSDRPWGPSRILSDPYLFEIYFNIIILFKTWTSK